MSSYTFTCCRKLSSLSETQDNVVIIPVECALLTGFDCCISNSFKSANGIWLLLPHSSIFSPNFSPHRVGLVRYAATTSYKHRVPTLVQQKQMFSGMMFGYGMYSDDRSIGWASAGLESSNANGIIRNCTAWSLSFSPVPSSDSQYLRNS